VLVEFAVISFIMNIGCPIRIFPEIKEFNKSKCRAYGKKLY